MEQLRTKIIASKRHGFVHDIEYEALYSIDVDSETPLFEVCIQRVEIDGTTKCSLWEIALSMELMKAHVR